MNSSLNKYINFAD